MHFYHVALLFLLVLLLLLLVLLLPPDRFGAVLLLMLLWQAPRLGSGQHCCCLTPRNPTYLVCPLYTLYAAAE